MAAAAQAQPSPEEIWVLFEEEAWGRRLVYATVEERDDARKRLKAFWEKLPLAYKNSVLPLLDRFNVAREADDRAKAAAVSNKNYPTLAEHQKAIREDTLIDFSENRPTIGQYILSLQNRCDTIEAFQEVCARPSTELRQHMLDKGFPDYDRELGSTLSSPVGEALAGARREITERKREVPDHFLYQRKDLERGRKLLEFRNQWSGGWPLGAGSFGKACLWVKLNMGGVIQDVSTFLPVTVRTYND